MGETNSVFKILLQKSDGPRHVVRMILKSMLTGHDGVKGFIYFMIGSTGSRLYQ